MRAHSVHTRTWTRVPTCYLSRLSPSLQRGCWRSCSSLLRAPGVNVAGYPDRHQPQSQRGARGHGWRRNQPSSPKALTTQLAGVQKSTSLRRPFSALPGSSLACPPLGGSFFYLGGSTSSQMRLGIGSGPPVPLGNYFNVRGLESPLRASCSDRRQWSRRALSAFQWNFPDGPRGGQGGSPGAL